MNDRNFIEEVRLRPGLYGIERSYDRAVMFLIGFDAARSGGLLRGFTEWLGVRRGEPSSFAWQALVLDEAAPEHEPLGWNKLREMSSEQERNAVSALLTLLHEFLTIRDDPWKLARMYTEYNALHAFLDSPEGAED